MTLDPDTALDVELSGVCSRHRGDNDPADALAELQRVAGGRTDMLAQVAGLWAGFYEQDPYQQVMLRALAEIPGADEWIPLGRERAGARPHSTPPRRH